MKRCLACDMRFVDGFACPACGWTPEVIDDIPAYAPEFAHSSPSFRPEYFPQLAEVEAGNFWFRSRNRLIRSYIRRYFQHASNIMEVGCGTGYALLAIAAERPQARLCGSEIYTAGLRFAATRVPHASLLQMDARAIPFDQEFDLVCAFDVLEHIQEDEAVLAQAHDALRPGGGLLLTVPQHQFLWSSQDVAACHVRRYGFADLRAKLQKAGFEILHSTSFVTLLLPLLAISRLLKRDPATDNPMSEFAIGATLNRLLYAIMRLEIWLLERGLRFAMGGTRIVAARRPA